MKSLMVIMTAGKFTWIELGVTKAEGGAERRRMKLS